MDLGSGCVFNPNVSYKHFLIELFLGRGWIYQQNIEKHLHKYKGWIEVESSLRSFFCRLMSDVPFPKSGRVGMDKKIKD